MCIDNPYYKEDNEKNNINYAKAMKFKVRFFLYLTQNNIF